MHRKKCKCEMCKNGMKKTMDKTEEMLKKYGWYIHHIPNDTQCPFQTNYHTHGFGYLMHPDMQLCLNFPPDFAQKLFRILYEKIKSGEKFEPGKIYSDKESFNFSITFIQIDQDLIRIIVADENNNLDIKTMNPEYALQFKVK